MSLELDNIPRLNHSVWKVKRLKSIIVKDHGAKQTKEVRARTKLIEEGEISVRSARVTLANIPRKEFSLSASWTIYETSSP